MLLLFLPFHIFLNPTSLLPSLLVPSIWKAAARKPGCIHNPSSKHQLIIRPAITQYTFHWFRTQWFFFCLIYIPEVSVFASHAKQSLPVLYIPWTGTVFWSERWWGRCLGAASCQREASFHRSPISRHGSGLPCQTASFVQLLIGIIYCSNRKSSCGFTA